MDTWIENKDRILVIIKQEEFGKGTLLPSFINTNYVRLVFYTTKDYPSSLVRGLPRRTSQAPHVKAQANTVANKSQSPVWALMPERSQHQRVLLTGPSHLLTGA